MVKIKNEQIEIIDIDEIFRNEDNQILSTFLSQSETKLNVFKNDKAYIDYSNIDNGYVKIKYLNKTNLKLKAQVKGKTTYTYNISGGIEYILPLSEYDCKYEVSIFEHVVGSSYKKILTKSFDVVIKNEFYTYLNSNIYVNYKNNDEVFNKAKILTNNKMSDIDKINSIYNWVVKNIKYDKKLASTVTSSYIPNLINLINKKSGICFDYATLTVAMLRSVGIPAKLVFGYAGNTYHAWIEVYSKLDGKINNNFIIKSNSWNRLDPTFDSNSKGNSSIIKYIGNGKNYLPKYYY